jgi:hypothetical protein
LPNDVALNALDSWGIKIDEGRRLANRKALETLIRRALKDNLPAIADRAPEFGAILLNSKKNRNAFKHSA